MITLQLLNHFRQQRLAKNQLTVSPSRKGFDIRGYRFGRGVAIFAKAFMGIPAQQAAKTTRPLMPAAAPAALLLSLDTQQGIQHHSRNDSTRCRKACIFTTQKALCENTCAIASGDYSTPVSQQSSGLCYKAFSRL